MGAALRLVALAEKAVLAHLAWALLRMSLTALFTGGWCGETHVAGFLVSWGLGPSPPPHVSAGGSRRRALLATHRAPPLPAALCFALTRSLLLTCLVPAGLLGLRYYYSRKVVLAYLDCALHTDMADIEQYYMKPPGEPSGLLLAPLPSCPPPQPFWQSCLRPGHLGVGLGPGARMT